MCRPKWPQNWTYYQKHRKATTRNWDDGRAAQWSEERESHSQYNPHVYGTDESVKSLELECVKQGTPILSGEKKWTFYLEKPGVEIGVCCGEVTSFVFAEWLKSNGTVHGRPISMKALTGMGVKI